MISIRIPVVLRRATLQLLLSTFWCDVEHAVVEAMEAARRPLHHEVPALLDGLWLIVDFLLGRCHDGEMLQCWCVAAIEEWGTGEIHILACGLLERAVGRF